MLLVLPSGPGKACVCHAGSPVENLEASPGIEPGYTDLQSAASPLRHEAGAGSLAEDLDCHKPLVNDGSGTVMDMRTAGLKRKHSGHTDHAPMWRSGTGRTALLNDNCDPAG